MRERSGKKGVTAPENNWHGTLFTDKKTQAAIKYRKKRYSITLIREM